MSVCVHLSSMWVYVCIWVQVSVATIRRYHFPGGGDTGTMNHLMWVLGNELGSSWRTVHGLNSLATSLAHYGLS